MAQAMSVPAVDLLGEYRSIQAEIDAAVARTLHSGWYILGHEAASFEEEFAAFLQARGGDALACVGVNSGTDALQLALMACDVGPGDEVITVSHTAVATAAAISLTGATPVFVDIDPQTYTMDPAALAAAITPRTKALMPVHLFGLVCDMDPIQAFAEAHGLAIIEDACQAHGAEYQGRKAGSFGTGCFSLYPTKNMTSAEGGMITTDDDEGAARCRILRQHGMQRRYYHDAVGYNFRMTDVHAAIGLAQLGKLEKHNQARIRNAAYLSQRLNGVVTPTAPEGSRHVFHQYTIRIANGQRDRVLELAESGVGSGIHYPVPIHMQQPAYKGANGRAPCPVAYGEGGGRNLIAAHAPAHEPRAELGRQRRRCTGLRSAAACKSPAV